MNHIECNRLVYDQEYGQKETYYETLGIVLSKEENSEINKYIRKFLSFDPALLDCYYQDEENESWTVIEFNENVHLVDIHYSVIKKARDQFFKSNIEDAD